MLVHKLKPPSSAAFCGNLFAEDGEGSLCGACGKPLAAKSERRQAYPYELKYEELAPFKVQMEMPLYKCESCGKEQIRSTKDLHGQVPMAMVGINDSAGFPHSG